MKKKIIIKNPILLKKPLTKRTLKNRNDSRILNIAKDLRDKLKEHDEDDFKALCLDISKKLQKTLLKKGISSKLIQGTFAVDNPDLNTVDEDDFDDENEYEKVLYNPIHFWLEIGNKILDLTSTQFQDEIENENLDTIVFDTYKNKSRYNKIKIINITKIN